MKTKYNTPEILICSMDNADVIATSNITGGKSNANGGPIKAEGDERGGNPIWD